MSGASDFTQVTLPAYSRQVLANGLTLILVSRRTLPSVTLSLLLPSGAARDSQTKGGCASLTMSLLNQGTTAHDADFLAGAVDRLGARFSTGTGWDSCSAGLTGLSEDLAELLGLLAEISLTPTFPEEEFLIMKRRRLGALARSLDNPSILADWVFTVNLYDHHVYGHPISGTARSVIRLTAADVRDFHRRHFVPGGAWLVIAGDFEAVSTAARVQEAFGAWQGSPPEALSAAQSAPGQRRTIFVHREDLTQAHIRWGYDAVRRSHPDFDALQVANYTLGGGEFSSRLMQRIRSDRGLTYGIRSSFDGRALTGPFAISTFTPNASVIDVLEEIDGIVGAYREEGPSEEELVAAKNRFIDGYPLLFETPSQLASRLLEVELYGLPHDSLQTYQKRVASLETGTIRELTRAFLHPDRALVVVVGNEKAIPPGLERFGTVERFDFRSVLGTPPAG
ncbi:MAG: M16 family metallopeptidase [Acidobacteriota bacterium]